ncbi:hypothetical protein PIB30_104898, partial [Stylosanthes scabra]|nr:hypothetical protein [Stylosanthes scabra]
MANQAQVNEELARLVKDTLKGKAISPGAASNSPAGRRSVAHKTSPAKGGTEVMRPPLRTYKRRRALTSSAIRDDPTYVPPVTPPSNDDTGSFYYTRSNKRGTTSAKKSSGTSRRGKRNLFPTNKGPPGIPPPDSSYLTSSPDRLRGYVDAMNFLQVRSRDTSRWVDEIGATLPSGITMTFRPTEDMNIVGLELAAAAYIFCPHLNQ